MGQNKQTPCQRCSAPAYGSVCRQCSLADLRSRKQAKGTTKFVNSVGEFNASGGFQSESGIAFPKVAPTVGPWWIGAPPDGFTQRCERQAPRMSRGVASNYRTSPEVWQ